MMLAGFETATNGEIFLDNRPINHVAPHKRDIGMVFQNYALFPHMTVFDNVAFGLSVRGAADADTRRRVGEILDLVQLTGLDLRRPKQLSGGQQQRVAIARALVNDPQLVLADEPTGALDSRTSVEIMALLQQLNRDGMTIVLVTHEHDVAAFASRLVMFRDGRIVSDERQAPRSAAETLRALDRAPEPVA